MSPVISQGCPWCAPWELGVGDSCGGAAAAPEWLDLPLVCVAATVFHLEESASGSLRRPSNPCAWLCSEVWSWSTAPAVHTQVQGFGHTGLRTMRPNGFCKERSPSHPGARSASAAAAAAVLGHVWGWLVGWATFLLVSPLRSQWPLRIWGAVLSLCLEQSYLFACPGIFCLSPVLWPHDLALNLHA